MVKEVGEQDTHWQSDSDKVSEAYCDIKDEVELNEELNSTSEGGGDPKSHFNCIV